MEQEINHALTMIDISFQEFLQDWAIQIITAVSVFYLIRQSKIRRNTEKLTQIKVDSMAYALGKTTVGDEFTIHYESEIHKRMKHENFIDKS